MGVGGGGGGVGWGVGWGGTAGRVVKDLDAAPVKAAGAKSVMMFPLRFDNQEAEVGTVWWRMGSKTYHQGGGGRGGSKDAERTSRGGGGEGHGGFEGMGTGRAGKVHTGVPGGGGATQSLRLSRHMQHSCVRQQ